VLVRFREEVQEVPRRVALLATVALVLGGGAALHAATAPDPILGSWRITAGGKGSIVISQLTSVLSLKAGSTGATLGCEQGESGDVVGFIDLPSRTKLPAGTYNGNIGTAGGGCYYVVRLKLNGSRLSGTVTYTENDVAGGPFAFSRVGSSKLTSHAWRVHTTSRGVALAGSGRISVDASGKVLGSGGTLKATVGSASWSLTIDPPGTLKRGSNGAFTLKLTAHITHSTCNDSTGTLLVTKGHAALTGLCDQPEVMSKGVATLK
jgi:hypothetical protein